MEVNPYELEPLPNEDFLRITYKLIIKKVIRLKEIESDKKRNKLPLPLLKEKVEIISNIYSALKVIIDNINYNNLNSKEYADILNDLGLMLSKANISQEPKEVNRYYDAVLAILDGFLN